jgi:citrate synthase
MTAHPAWIPAADAATLLGVSRTTLYAYVSRGFVRSQASSTSATRERVYARDDLERLRRRSEERRAPDKAAARALQWGMPILESSISCIDGEQLYYRGLGVAGLARTRTLEEVAALIWTGRLDWTPPPQPARVVPPRAALPFVPCAQAMLATAAAADPSAFDLRRDSVAATGLYILRVVTRAATRGDPRGLPAHLALARAWRAGPRGADLIRAALVLCADHELNVSSFTARCVASAGTHPYGAVLAGLAALEGPRHGGSSARAESMLETMRRARPLRAAVSARLRRGESIDGFGHPLYPSGDPRARMLLAMAGQRYRGSAEYRFVAEFARVAGALTGEHPNLDFSLAAVCRVAGLPAGAALTLFAIGRTAGWIGHALEQYATGQLIRPRAKYVGLPPAVSVAAPRAR